MSDQALRGTAVTVLFSNGDTDEILTAAPPAETRKRLNQLLVTPLREDERAITFVSFESVDADTVRYYNLDFVQSIDTEPVTLADLAPTAEAKKPARKPQKPATKAQRTPR